MTFVNSPEISSVLRGVSADPRTLACRNSRRYICSEGGLMETDRYMLALSVGERFVSRFMGTVPDQTAGSTIYFK